MSTSKAFDQQFITSYYTLDKSINESIVYAVDNEWWANLDFFINLKVESQDQFEDWNEELKNDKLIEKNIKFKSLDNIVFSENGVPKIEKEKFLNKLKDDVKYNQDYIFVNSKVWSFITKYFTAGPILKYYTYQKNSLNSNDPKELFITNEQENSLANNLIIPLDLSVIKIYYRANNNNYTKFITIPIWKKAPLEKVLKIAIQDLVLTIVEPIFINCNSNITIIGKDNKEKTLEELKINHQDILILYDKFDDTFNKEKINIFNINNINESLNKSIYGIEEKKKDSDNKTELNNNSCMNDELRNSIKTGSTDISNDFEKFCENEKDRENLLHFDNFVGQFGPFNPILDNHNKDRIINIEINVLKEKSLKIKDNQKIKLYQRDILEIKKNINKIIKQYNVKKIKIKPQQK